MNRVGYVLPYLVIIGCGILAPEDEVTISVWWTPSELGVVFRAESWPPDTVFYSLEFYANEKWREVAGVDPDGSVDHALVWIPDQELIAKFKAWGPRAKPDSVWFGHVPSKQGGAER